MCLNQFLLMACSTKSGKSWKGRLDFSYATTFQQAIDRVEMMNSREYALASIDAVQNAWIDKGGDPNAANTLAARGAYNIPGRKHLIILILLLIPISRI